MFNEDSFSDFNADPYDIGIAPTPPTSLAQKIAIAFSFLSPLVYWVFSSVAAPYIQSALNPIYWAFLVALVFGYIATAAWCAFRRQWAVVVAMVFYAAPFAMLLWFVLTLDAISRSGPCYPL